jgi:hypothetical protein
MADKPTAQALTNSMKKIKKKIDKCYDLLEHRNCAGSLNDLEQVLLDNVQEIAIEIEDTIG